MHYEGPPERVEHPLPPIDRSPVTTTAPAPLPAYQEWHRLLPGLQDCLRAAATVAGAVPLEAIAPAAREGAAVVVSAEAWTAALTVVFDLAFQAGRDSRGVIDDADKLWAVHHRGSDDIIAQPSRQAANGLVTALDRMDVTEAAAHPETAALHHAVVVEWPFSADAHAEELADQEREGTAP